MKNYPLIKFTLIFICGIITSKFLNISTEALIIALILTSLISFLLNKYYSQNSFIKLIIIVPVFLTGVLTFQVQSKSVNYLPENLYNYKDISAFGKVDEIDLLKDDELTFILKSDSIKFKDSTLHSRIKFLIKLKESKRNLKKVYSSILSGNYLKITGRYRKGREMRNPGEFDYNKYLRSIEISGIIYSYDYKDVKIINEENDFYEAVVFKIRKAIDSQINKFHNEETAGLLKGLLLADRSQIDYETKTEFVNSGVIHVLAVSGLHVGFITIIFYFLFGRLNIYSRVILTILGLLIFLIITGSPASVFRATVMAVVFLISFLTNRSTNIFNSLAFAALFLLILNPLDLFNPGFQLSFSAVLSIGFFAPIFNRKINALGIKFNFTKNILLFISVSLAAQIGTLPFTLIYFGKLSLIALLANLIVIPLIGIVLAVGIITLTFSLISSWLAGIFAVSNMLATKLLFLIINFAGNLDFSYLRIINFSVYDAFIFYTSLFLLIYGLKISKQFITRLVLSLLIILNFSLFISLDNKDLLTKNELNILMIDVGQGDSILLKFPDGKTALIDAGAATPYFDNGERVIIPLLEYLGIEKLDYGFISHLDNDHYGGFVSLIINNKIGKLYKPSKDTTSSKDNKFEKFLIENNQEVKYYSKRKFDIGNTRIFILNDQEESEKLNFDSNNNSGVIKIVYGNTEFLFPGDIESKAERYFAAKYKIFLQSDLLKVAHHGSKTSSTEKFINFVNPHFDLISAGIDNKFGHPDKNIVERLRSLNSKVFRTDQEGAILLRSNGENIRKVNWKNIY